MLLPFARWLARVRPSPDLPVTPGVWSKVDLIHRLADIHGYRSLLEISTARSAGSYPTVDQSRFKTCRRLSYLTPDDWSDGAPVDYRAGDRNTAECTRQIRGQGLRFDMVFIDASHEYEDTRRDMEDALTLVAHDGVVIMHDCLPNDAELSIPHRGELIGWFGVSYKYYADLLTARNDLWACTVDIDFGCGIVRKRQKSSLYRRGTDGPAALIAEWRGIGDDFSAAYRFYERHKRDLVNVVVVDDFLAAEEESARWRFRRRRARTQR